MRTALATALVTGVAAASIAVWQRPALVAYFAPNACGDSAIVAWEPMAPKQGALFRVRAQGVPAASSLAGTVATQPLHFTRPANDSVNAEAFAAIPIDGSRSIAIVVRCSSNARTDSLVVTIAAAVADYPLEKLTVAPEFGRPPDSATAVRISQENERARIVAVRAHNTPRLWTEAFILPRVSRITSEFGSGREFNGTVTSRHMGTDFQGAPGAPVRAANRGVARIVAPFFYGGNVVYLDHGAGITTAYLHLSKQNVVAGDTVARGQIIGEVGATGRVTGPHLHLILRYGNVTVDPMSLFAIAGDTTVR